MADGTQSTTRHRVWVVDDVDLERELARRALAENYLLETFGDGASVIESAVRGSLPDVLVLDWHMTGITGLEVLRFLRANAATEALPILVFTATGNAEDLLDALGAGADDYVDKAGSNAELNARVANLIRIKGLRERAERAERELVVLLHREREARSEAEAANRAKDHFLATVSHELRTPLNAIHGWARILATVTVDEALTQRAVATIERNALAQAKIIDDLLDISRIVSGKLRLEFVRVELGDAIAQAVESLRPSAAAKRLTVDVDLDPDCAIAGDPERLLQVAWNLLSNAVKFTPEGGRVGVRLRREGATVVLRVEDTGRGIAAEVLPRVFDRFHQADSSTTRAHGGLGLGLAIVRQLVELHGGTVSAASAGLGRGAVFEVSLPALLVDPAVRRPAVPPETAPPADPRALEGLTVLIVDDEPDAREMLRILLVACRAEVVPVGSAAEALAALDRQRPDVIVSDIAMPHTDGLSLLRAVRRRPDGVSIPAVALTALARDEDRAAAAGAGFQAHVSKPVDPDRLLRTIAQLCGR